MTKKRLSIVIVTAIILLTGIVIFPPLGVYYDCGGGDACLGRKATALTSQIHKARRVRLTCQSFSPIALKNKK